MKLVSADGSSLELAIDGYQFPANENAISGKDWDSNWLYVRGNVSLPDGRTHQFRDPCLTTWEARELRGWLTAIWRREITSPSDKQPSLVFTEPDISLGLEQTTNCGVVLRVYLSFEAEPSFVLEGSQGSMENYLRLTMTLAELGDAIAEWEAELQAFPVR
jgi:hypothetical protein